METDILDQSQLKDLTVRSLRIKDNTLDENIPSSAFPLGKVYTHRPPEFDLGTLDVLPLELIQDVLSQLDLYSLTTFRRINRRAVEVVESIPQYKAITTHALDALRGSLSIGTGHLISCETLYEKLCTAECEECGDFAGYLYIYTCKRVCYLCFTDNENYGPLLRRHAMQEFGFGTQVLKTLPSMMSAPGRYSPNDLKRPKSLILIDFESTFRAGIAHHGSAYALWRYRVSFTGRARPKLEDPVRFMAVVRLPWLNKSVQKVESGFYCVGCRDSNVRGQRQEWTRNHLTVTSNSHIRGQPPHWRRKYTVASFNEHLNRCGRIENGKHRH